MTEADINTQAKDFESQGRFAEAAEIRLQQYRDKPDVFVLTRYLHCARKLGVSDARTAVQFAREHGAVGLLQEHMWLRREYVWAVYTAFFRVAAEAADDEQDEQPDGPHDPSFTDLIEEARAVLAITDEDLPRKLIVFATMKLAKERKAWDILLELAGSLKERSLSRTPNTMGGRTTPSDHLRWMYGLTRAHVELEQWEDALNLAHKGLVDYPNDKFLTWWQGKAQVGSGQAEDGLTTLVKTDTRFPEQWYILRDIGETYEALGNLDESMLWYCKAASAPGDLHARINMLADMSSLLGRLGRWSSAADHMMLAWKLSGEKPGWERTTAKLQEGYLRLVRDTADSLGLEHRPDDTACSVRHLITKCRREWEVTVRTAAPCGTGKIEMMNIEKGFGFIKDAEGTSYYFRCTDLQQGGALGVGAPVSFSITKAFDAKKNTESFRAINISKDDG